MRSILRLALVTTVTALVAAGCEEQSQPAPGSAAEAQAVTASGAAGATGAATAAAAGAAGAAQGGEEASCGGKCDGDCDGNKGAGCDCAKCDGDCDCDGNKGAKAACGGDCKGSCGGKKAAAGDEANCPFADKRSGAHAKAAAGGEKKAGCGAHAAEAAPGTTSAGDGEAKHYGSAFSVEESQGLAAILDGDDEPGEETVRVRGTIESVCQKRGCWFVLRDGESEARITMKDYAFTIPTDVKGEEAEVEGVVEVRTFDEAEVKHLEADRGGDPSKVSGSRREFVLTASGVRI